MRKLTPATYAALSFSSASVPCKTSPASSLLALNCCSTSDGTGTRFRSASFALLNSDTADSKSDGLAHLLIGPPWNCSMCVSHEM
ncbi:hypothetical protein BDZ91DRAFT_744664 [Kalaharituber pfeilii]|nr:hypothetical protein BDZ91DRAFT_744664 [Kalaharituber pfeilii]